MDEGPVITLGRLQIRQGLFASPLAGITKRANRVLARRYGCEMAYTEMIKAAGLVAGNTRTRELLKRDCELEDALGIQLAEGDPAKMREAAEMVADMDFDVVDINMGCPARKITCDCSGAGLLRDPPRAREVMQAVRSTIPRVTPVTVKIRLGWDPSSYVHLLYARMAQEEGLSLITVHGRTAQDKYGTPVDYERIAEVVREVTIPVVGNGDVADGPSAKKMLDETGCAGVMIGRASQGNPWVFREVSHYLSTGQTPPPPPRSEVVSVLREHFKMLVEDEGERRASLQIRKLASWYLQGEVPRSFIHERIFGIEDAAGFEALLSDIGGLEAPAP